MAVNKILWLASLAAPASSVLAAYGLGLRGRRLYLLASTCACLLLAVASAPLAFELLGDSTSASVVFGGLEMAPLSLILVPFTATLWFLTVVTTPIGRLDETGLARTAASCLLTITAFLSASPGVLAVCWIATSFLFVAGHGGEYFRRPRRMAAISLGFSSALLVAGILLGAWNNGGAGSLEQWSAGLILAAVLIRKGIFPFHAWLPEIFDRGRIGPATLFSAPQLGTYVALALAVPRAGATLLYAVAMASLVTTVWGGLLALRQTQARRACGYLFVSQSAMVLASFALSSREALTGALILWVSSGIAVAGLSRCVLALEARRGRLKLDSFHGGFDRMPFLAASFLILSLAISNFPGTLGFVGGEMLIQGAVDSFPVLGLFAVTAVALNSLAVMRMYFSLFCGKVEPGIPLWIKRQEGWGFAAAALIMVGFGVAPRGIIRIISRASATVLESRRDLAPDRGEIQSRVVSAGAGAVRRRRAAMRRSSSPRGRCRERR